LRPETAAPTKTHTYLLAETSLPDMFSGQAKLLYVKNENPTLGQRLKNFILRPLKIVAAKASLLNVLRDSAFKDNEDAKKLTNHIKGLGFFEGVSTFKVKDFLVDAALHGSRLASASNTANNAEKSLAEFTGAALNEHLAHPGHMYITLQHHLGGEEDMGLEEFYRFQKDPLAVLSDTQITKIHSVNRRMDALKNDPNNSKKIPNEVFIKFSEIYEDLSKRLLAKDLVLSSSNLVDRLLQLNPRSTNVGYFLGFFQPTNPNILGNTAKAMAGIFKQNLAELAKTLDPYGEDASMRATLEILADEFLAHANNPEKPWATAEAVKTLNQELKTAKEEQEKHWK
jgi:hypothetical protein